MLKDWSNGRVAALAPLMAVIVLFMTASYAKEFRSFCGACNCDGTGEGSIWKAIKLDADVDRRPEEIIDPKERSAKDFRERESMALRFSSPLMWYFLSVLNLFVCVAALGVAWVVGSRLFPDRLVWPLLVIALSFSVGLILYHHREAHMAIFCALFPKTISKDVPRITDFTNLLNSISNTAAFSLILTSCAALWPAAKGAPEEGLGRLSDRMKGLRLVLYVGTLLLVVNMLLKKAIYLWALAFTSREEQAAKISMKFVSDLLTVEGGYYTLMLAAVYLPAAYILQRRAHLSRELPEDESKREEALKEYGMTFSLADSLPRILAILGPMLAGPVGELLNRVS